VKLLLGFALGYVVGAKAGSAGFDRVEVAVRELRDSEEYHRVVDAVREHAKETVQVMNRRLRQGAA
jgi:hypothetical protein